MAQGQESIQENGQWLHYIGKGLYTRKTFETEARKYGVSRAIPIKIAKSMKWGEKIFLAFFEGLKEDCTEQEALVFGYFTIDKVNYQLPDELRDKFLSQLDVVHHEDYTKGGSEGLGVSRKCGSYSIASSTTVTNSLQECLEKYEQICLKHGINPKIFLQGDYCPIEPIRVFAPFTRSVARLELPINGVGESKEPEKAAQQIKDYKKNHYMPKRAKRAPQLTVYM